jgi:hypothetical protein
MYRLIKLLVISDDQQAPFLASLRGISGQQSDTLPLSRIHMRWLGDDEVVGDHIFRPNVGS